MRKCVWLCLLAAGCVASPKVKLHVDPAAGNRLDPALRQRASAAVEVARATLKSAQADVNSAEAERAAPASLAGKPRTPLIDAVLTAAEARRSALITWRQAQVGAARWNIAVAEAQLELTTAEAVVRNGVDVDPARFKEQSADMENEHQEAMRVAAEARTRLDAKERALNDAKDHYAATLRVVPPPPTAQAATAR